VILFGYRGASCWPPQADSGLRDAARDGDVGYCFVANRDGGVCRWWICRTSACVSKSARCGPQRSSRASQVRQGLRARARDGHSLRIDALQLRISRKVRLGRTPPGCGYPARGDALWVLTANAQSRRCGSTRCARRAASSRRRARCVRSAVQTEDALIVSRSGHSITRLTRHRASDAGCPTAVEPSIACFRKDGKQLIAGSEADRSLTICDTATGRTWCGCPLHCAAAFLHYRGRRAALLTGDGMDVVVTVYPSRTELPRRVCGRAPGAMAITETNPSYLLVANPQTEGSRPSTWTREVVAMVHVGNRGHYRDHPG